MFEPKAIIVTEHREDAHVNGLIGFIIHKIIDGDNYYDYLCYFPRTQNTALHQATQFYEIIKKNKYVSTNDKNIHRFRYLYKEEIKLLNGTKEYLKLINETFDLNFQAKAIKLYTQILKNRIRS